MWGDPDPDPGGGPPGPQSSIEIKDLKDQNEQQQVLIAQLKEMLRKEQSSVPQEKVEEYIHTLSKAKAKKSRLKRDEAGTVEKSGSSMDNRKHEKVNLLKQQLEENKAKLAERGMRQKDLEEMVTVIKAQLNDSQQLISSTPVPISSLEKNLEYNKNTSPEELYNILLVKEKRITDLLDKNQKNEATILDLQENLKEKDSVIDARTKAITLMTDNLSKKGKDTLDALDETKEQMRRMQENFITLESEMKARQMVLLNDLKSKNIEIADLQEEIKKLIHENESLKNDDVDRPESDNHEVIIKDLKQKLDESKKTITENEFTLKEFQNKIIDLENKLETDESSDQKQNSEIEKLRKQLDESNKNMIKVKAQNKSKIKELNKKLDGFKKMSDANATIIQLQKEITKLNEKIAELEEEKGNMQLKMVESIESIKGSTHSDDVKELQEKLERSFEELDEKDKIINLLDTDINSLKSEINELNEKISGLSQAKNEQVTSELKSVQIEEQLENMESSNKKLQNEIDDLRKEKEELLEKIEEFTKEKLELTTKLDSYIQENMELIDKLEKLSAEKVSSAESIEIVENLTQQEKLELEAYQENMDANLEDSIKPQEEEPPAELNESVLQLTEETAELLKKIEMFNMERKEVMAKMEALREENNQLVLKLNEVENNRDILAETYEQVQTEKDELAKENEELVQKMKEMEPNVSTGDTESFANLQTEYETLKEENDNLKRSLKQFDANIQEKHNLDEELAECEEKIIELESKLKQSLEEITNYQAIIEENKNEFINSSDAINKLQNELAEREDQITELNSLISDLNQLVDGLQEANSKLTDFETMEKQLEDLKTSLNEQIESAQSQAEEFKEELEFNKKTHEEEIEKKNRELERLERTEEELKKKLEEKDASVKGIIEEMKQKYLGLQNQLNTNSGSLEKQVEELSNKNKEQLEKMKKIAANLKKKTQAYQELEEKFNEEKEKWETEVNRKEIDTEDTVAHLLQEIRDLKEEVVSKSSILLQSERRIEELSLIIATLETQNADLQNLLQKQEKVTEISLKQELSTSLHEEFDSLHGNNESTNEDKLKELQLIIETNEAELNHYKEKTQTLEEDLAVLLEEKENLLAKSSKLEEKLEQLSKSADEKSLLEDEIDRKLQEFAVSTKRIEELTKENKELTNKNRDQEELIAKLKIKIKKTQEKMTQLKSLQSSLEEQEQANNDLKNQIAHLETIIKQTQADHEEKQKQNQRDYERIESDYQSQLEDLVKNRNDLTFECEKLQENLKISKEREQELAAELQEANQKLSDTETQLEKKIEALQTEIETLRSQLVVEAAKNTVEDIITDATDKINTKNTQTEDFFQQNERITREENPVVQMNHPQKFFQWGEQKDSRDWFDRNDFSGSAPQSLSVTKEDLENKIKALEVLLYNVDQEKKEVIQECSEMLNELTRLVYEKVQNFNENDQKNQLNLPVSELEAQIMSQNDIETLNDPLKLQQTEFTTSNPPLGEQSVPVNEEVQSPSTAYVTFQPLSELESQIMSPKDIEALEDPLKLQHLEFEDTDPSLGPQHRPVPERLAQPSKVYLTYQTGENDDGWGWGPEEAQLEEEHQYRTENTPQVQALRTEIDDLRKKMQILQTEKDNHLEEIKQLQLKSGKLVRKCKELKLKNDQLAAKTKSDTSDFFDLDQTIQEELKTQMQQLETKIKEVSSELEKEKHEKSNHLKRIDVLTSANEKMVEMKEIQESEIYRWKRKYEEMQEKLDWGSEESKPKPQPKENANEDIEELKKLVQDLTVDNEELQALLNDQKQQRVQLERSQSIGSEDILSKNALIEENNKTIKELEGKLQNLEKELENVKHQAQTDMEQQNCSLKELKLNNEQLESLIKEKDEMMKELEEKIRNSEWELQQKQQQAQTDMEQKHSALKELEAALKLTEEKLEATLKEKQTESQTNTQLEELRVLLSEKTVLAQQFQQSNDTLNNEILELRRESELLKQELNQITENLQHQQRIEDVNPVIQEFTRFQANSIKELIELSNQERNSFYEQINTSRNDYEGRINELKEELSKQKEQYQELQELTAKNILDLQTELEEQKSKNDQLQIENVDKFKKLSEESGFLQEKELRGLVEELQSNKLELESNIKSLKNELNNKQLELDRIVGELETKLAETVTELEEKWSAQVDERGNTVAESWKCHLALVETDFEAIQAKLKTEIDELDEKCNALVNENNELRRNVDAEIKNEVDRISAVQQQINDRQQAINELKQMLLAEQVEKAALVQKASDADDIQQILANKEIELASLKTLAETTRQQCDEKREVVEEIVRILEKNTSYPLSCEKQDILNEIQRQLDDCQEFNRLQRQLDSSFEEIDRLKSQLSAVDVEIRNLTEQLQEKEAEIAELKEKHGREISEKMEEIRGLNAGFEELKSQTQQIGFEEGEIRRLEGVVEEYKAQLATTQAELQDHQKLCAESNYAVEDYKQKLEEFRLTHISLQNTIEDKNQQINALNQHINTLNQQLQQSVDNRETEKLESELAQFKDACATMQQSLAESQQQLFNLTQDLATKTHEYETVTQQLAYSQQNTEIMQEEINKLKQTLHLKEQEYAVSLENIEKTRYKELESHYEELLEAKNLDIQTLRSQVAESVYNTNENSRIKTELEERMKQLETQLLELSTAKTELETKLLDQNKLNEEENNQLSEMRAIIEEQVVKIEELKKELFQKSNDYDSLIAEMDISRNAITQQPVPSGPRVGENPPEERPKSREDDLSEPVNRAELDLALYMLHQRDVRCEELTVELTQLLEERDTLQLRLSNAIREKEELRRKTTGSTEAPSTDALPGTPKSSRSSEIFLAASGTELASEPTEELTVQHDLASKLSELKTVGYKRDKTFVDEQEQRRMQQISIMQEHIKEAAKLPPEAAAKLVDASYTLSRDVQSPSKVLLNWLWGRSTPRVNDT